MISISNKKINKMAWVSIVLLLILYCCVRIFTVFFGFFSLSYIKFILLLAFALSLISICAYRNQFRFFSTKELTALLLVFLLILFTIVQTILFQDAIDIDGRSAHQNLIGSAFYNTIWLFIGYAIQLNISFKHQKIIPIFIVSLLLFIVLRNTQGGLLIDYRLLDDTFKSTGAGALTHLSIGFPFHLLLITSYAVLSDRLKIYIIPFSIFILFAIGGRTDLGLYILALFFYEIFRGVLNARLLFFITILVFFLLLVPFLIEAFPENSHLFSRMTFSEGVEEDSSFQARTLFLEKTIETLPSQFLIGDISQIVRSKGTVGSYSHNLLSAWEYYGFLVFTIIVVFFVSNFNRVKSIAKEMNSPLSTLIVLIYLTAALGLIVAKNVDFIFLWLSIGILSGDFDKRYISNKGQAKV